MKPSSKTPLLRVATVAWMALPLGLAALAPSTLPAQETPTRSVRPEAAVPGSELRVWLVTAGPGDAVWERYGHNAIRVLDTATGRDVSYNWGIFDFDQVDFIPRFLQGRMLYMMAPFPTEAMIDAYARANREVVLQELDLTPPEKTELRDFAEINALPQNRDYIYQYFLDNCSTRVRDLLDQVLDGRLESEFAGEPTGTSFRFHTRRLTQVDPLIYTGMDLLLGAPTDQPISVWEEMFLPLTLRDEIRRVEVARADGSVRPLVSSEEVVAESTRAREPQAPPGWLWIYLLIGVAFGATFGALRTEKAYESVFLRRSILAVGTLWAALGGVAGVILLGLLFTDHTFAYWNENLFLANPMMLAVAILLPLSGLGPAWRGRALWTARLLLGVALVGLLWQLLPASSHQNAMFFALLLPGHLGMAWGLAARSAGRV